MSKTHFSIACETNKAAGKPQENVFFQGAYRKPEDYRQVFAKSAGSEALFQVFAVFSARGKDDIAAAALQQIMKTFGDLVAQAQLIPSPNFEAFSARITRTLNDLVCNISLANKGTPIKVSFTAAVMIGDVLRIISMGNTRAFLIRQNKVIRLTEDQTVAHRYVQMGAISPEEEQTHPESEVLTQYLGKFQQDGPTLPENKTYLKLTPGDEVVIVGAGISRYIPSNVFGFIASKTSHPQIKADELIKAAAGGGAKGGLTTVVVRVTGVDTSAPVVVPAFASLAANTNQSHTAALGLAGSDARDVADTSISGLRPGFKNESFQEIETADGNIRAEGKPVKTNKPWAKRLVAILLPVVLFVLFAFIGYFSTYAIISGRKIVNEPDPNGMETVDQEQSLNKVMYSVSDQVPVYTEESTKSQILQYLIRGEALTLISQSGTFSKIKTAAGNTGYVISIMLSEIDPTIGQEEIEMTADPTPIPEFTTPTTTKATEPPETEPTAPTTTQTTAPTTATTTAPTETTPTEPSVTETTVPETTVTVPETTPVATT